MAAILSRPVKDWCRWRELGVASGNTPGHGFCPRSRWRDGPPPAGPKVAGYYLDRPQVAEEPRAGPVIT